MPAAAIPPRAGVGWRPDHHAHVLEHRPPAAWLEVHSENFFINKRLAAKLLQAREVYPISLHGVGLSLGSAHGIDADQLHHLAALVDAVDPGLVSDHLSWSTTDGVSVPELLAVPYTDDAMAVFVRNIDQVQTALRRRILIENPSRGFAFAQSTIEEPQFLSEITARTGCGILLDVNNVCVSAHNLGADPFAMLQSYLSGLRGDDIGEIHLAGHLCSTLPDGTPIRIDTHDTHVFDEVWQMYAQTIAHFGPKPTLIEWDDNLPDFGVLLAEADKAQVILDRVAAHA